MVALAASQPLDRAGMLMRMDETPQELLEFTPENIKKRREYMRISQTALGQMLDPPAGQGTIVHWESGNYRVKSPRKEQLAKILGLALPGEDPVANMAAVRAEVKIDQMRSLLDALERDIKALR